MFEDLGKLIVAIQNNYSMYAFRIRKIGIYVLCRLFEDKIYAFKYGPVVESVYEAYKGMKDIEEGLTSD